MPLKLRKRGKVYHARGTVPHRLGDGTVTGRRIEVSTRTGEHRRAKEIAASIERDHFARAYGDEAKSATFAGAAAIYMQTTGTTRFVKPLIKHFKTTPLDEIDQAAALDAGKKLYPGVKPSTLNRQLFTPLLAILNLAARQKLCAPPGLERPKNHAKVPPLDIPSEDWFTAVMPECRPQLAALIAFMTLSGRRISEALAIAPDDLDLTRGEATIHTTKTDVPVIVPIPDPVTEWLRTDKDWHARERVFGYKSRANVRRDVRLACGRAKVRYYPTRAFGRHAFATRLLKAGLSLAFVKDAGHWKTIKMVADRYGHLERREVDAKVREIGAAWGKNGAIQD